MSADFGKLFEQARSGSVLKRKSEEAPTQAPAPSSSSKRKKRKKNKAAPQPAAETEPAPVSAPQPKKLEGKMASQLAGARFRDINERLYTQDSSRSLQLFQSEPRLFSAYHEGFRLQAQRWPLRPLDVYIRWLREQVPARQRSEALPQRPHHPTNSGRIPRVSFQ